MDNHNSLRQMIWGISERGDFPGPYIEERHIEQIENFQESDNGKYRFQIERHPPILGGGGKRELGFPAFQPVLYTYELDTAKKEVVLLDEKKCAPVINYEMLAEHHVDMWEEGISPSEFDRDFKNISSEQDVEEYAKEKFKEFNFRAGIEDEASDIEEFDVDRFMSEVQDSFIQKIKGLWDFYKTEVEEEED